MRPATLPVELSGPCCSGRGVVLERPARGRKQRCSRVLASQPAPRTQQQQQQQGAGGGRAAAAGGSGPSTRTSAYAAGLGGFASSLAAAATATEALAAEAAGQRQGTQQPPAGEAQRDADGLLRNRPRPLKINLDLALVRPVGCDKDIAMKADASALPQAAKTCRRGWCSSPAEPPRRLARPAHPRTPPSTTPLRAAVPCAAEAACGQQLSHAVGPQPLAAGCGGGAAQVGPWRLCMCTSSAGVPGTQLARCLHLMPACQPCWAHQPAATCRLLAWRLAGGQIPMPVVQIHTCVCASLRLRPQLYFQVHGGVSGGRPALRQPGQADGGAAAVQGGAGAL